MAKGSGSTRGSSSSSPRGLRSSSRSGSISSIVSGSSDAISMVEKALTQDLSGMTASQKADLQSQIANQAMRDIDAIRQKAAKDDETLRAVLDDTDYMFAAMKNADEARKKVIELKEKQAQSLEKLSKHLWS